MGIDHEPSNVLQEVIDAALDLLSDAFEARGAELLSASLAVRVRIGSDDGLGTIGFYGLEDAEIMPFVLESTAHTAEALGVTLTYVDPGLN